MNIDDLSLSLSLSGDLMTSKYQWPIISFSVATLSEIDNFKYLDGAPSDIRDC